MPMRTEELEAPADRHWLVHKNDCVQTGPVVKRLVDPVGEMEKARYSLKSIGPLSGWL